MAEEEHDEEIDNLFRKIHNENKCKNVNIQSNLNEQIKEQENDEYDENLFPINTKVNLNKQSEINDLNIEFGEPINISEEERLQHRQNILRQYNLEGVDSEIEKSKTMNDLMEEDSNLKEQYENLNTYYNFAVKSLNYFIPKLGKGLADNNENDQNNLNENNEIKSEVNVDDNNFEKSYIMKASNKINKLFYDSIKEASKKIDNIDEFNKKLEDEDTNVDVKIKTNNPVDNPPEEEQEERLNIFKKYLLTDTMKITTPDLLSKIVNIINSTYLDEIKIRNDDLNEVDEPQSTGTNTIMNTTTIKENINNTININTSSDNNNDNLAPKKYK
jgi:chromosome segregation protein